MMSSQMRHAPRSHSRSERGLAKGRRRDGGAVAEGFALGAVAEVLGRDRLVLGRRQQEEEGLARGGLVVGGAVGDGDPAAAASAAVGGCAGAWRSCPRARRSGA